MADPAHEGDDGRQEAEVRHLPVPVEASEPRPVDRPTAAPLPAPVVAATGGFLAGFATLVLAGVLRRRRPARGRLVRRRSRRGDRALEVAGTRSFLVDVHLLKR